MDHKDSDLKLISEQPLSPCLGSASTTSSTPSAPSTPSASSNALVASNGAFESHGSTVPTSIVIPMGGMGGKEYKQEQTCKVEKACFGNTDTTDTTDTSVATTNKADTPDTASTSILQDGNAMLAPLPLVS